MGAKITIIGAGNVGSTIAFALSDEDMSIIRELNLNDCGTRDYTSHEYASKIISQVF